MPSPASACRCVRVNNEDVKEFYLGLSQVGAQKSYRQLKYYKRRKRWLG